MVTLRSHLELLANFPDDIIEEDGEIILYPGRNVAGALSESLAARGYAASEPSYEGEKGWSLHLDTKRSRFWLQVTPVGDDECYLVTEDQTWRLWSNRAAFSAFLLDLQAVLKSDSRFSQIKWFPRGGAASNIPASDGPIDN